MSDQSISEEMQAPENPRKRAFEASEEDSKITMTSNKVVVHQWKTNKKIAHQEQRPSQDKTQEAFQIPSEKVPRRSQKLCDKITALQKLVSPYGKTDTASVLEEAFISIKLLQQQIQVLHKYEQKLYKKSSSSSANTEPIQYQRIDEKPLDLQSKGLCLVPVSFTQLLAKQEQFNRLTMSRSFVMPRNFAT